MVGTGKVAGGIVGAVATVSALVLASACGPASRVDSDEAIVVEGVVLASDGAPLDGARMRLMREPSITELIAFVANPVGLGLWCIVREATEEPGCVTFRVGDTDAQGRWSVMMEGSDTQKEFGAARHFWTGTRAGDASVSVGFYVMEPSVLVPDVMIWDAMATAADDGSDLRIAWTEAMTAPTGERAGSYSVAIEDADGGPVWEVEGLAVTELRIDRRILEDVGLRHRVAAHTTRAGSGTEFHIVQTGPAGTAAAGTFQPASRGASCTYRNGAGTEVALAPCPLTDGSFSTFLVREDAAVCEVGSEGECRGASFEEVVIDLGALRTTPGIVVHATGSPSAERTDVRIEASADGITWSRVADTLAPFRTHTGPAAARFVRLRRDVEDGAASRTAFARLVNEVAID